MPPCKCTLLRPQKPWSRWPWIVAYQQKEKKDGAGRRSLYPKCNEHGNPLHTFSDGTNTVPVELKPKYKSRKPRAEPDEAEQIPTSTLLSQRKAENLGAPPPGKRKFSPDKDDPDAEYQPKGNQVPQPKASGIPLCMQMKVDEKNDSQPQLQPQSQPRDIQVTKPKDYFADQLNIALSILESEGVHADSLLWTRVRETYLNNPVDAIVKRGRNTIGSENNHGIANDAARR